MSYKITVSSNYNYSIKQRNPPKFKVTSVYTNTIMPQKLADLEDVNIDNENDKYVLMYDANDQKWKSVNPDDVLSAATTEPIQPGLPADFENRLDLDLDNRIDLDAGNF